MTFSNFEDLKIVRDFAHSPYHISGTPRCIGDAFPTLIKQWHTLTFPSFFIFNVIFPKFLANTLRVAIHYGISWIVLEFLVLRSFSVKIVKVWTFPKNILECSWILATCLCLWLKALWLYLKLFMRLSFTTVHPVVILLNLAQFLLCLCLLVWISSNICMHGCNALAILIQLFTEFATSHKMFANMCTFQKLWL